MSENILPPTEIGEDEIADGDTVTLLSDDGAEIEFVEIAGIVHKGSFYAILQPVVPLEGMAEDEAIVFEVTKGEDGNDAFFTVEDDEIIDAVFAEYTRMYEKIKGESEDEE